MIWVSSTHVFFLGPAPAALGCHREAGCWKSGPSVWQDINLMILEKSFSTLVRCALWSQGVLNGFHFIMFLRVFSMALGGDRGFAPLKASRRNSQRSALVDLTSGELEWWRTWMNMFECDTFDGRNPANQLRLVVYPIIYRVFSTIRGGLSVILWVVLLPRVPVTTRTIICLGSGILITHSSSFHARLMYFAFFLWDNLNRFWYLICPSATNMILLMVQKSCIWECIKPLFFCFLYGINMVSTCKHLQPAESTGWKTINHRSWHLEVPKHLRWLYLWAWGSQIFS